MVFKLETVNLEDFTVFGPWTDDSIFLEQVPVWCTLFNELWPQGTKHMWNCMESEYGRWEDKFACLFFSPSLLPSLFILTAALL